MAITRQLKRYEVELGVVTSSMRCWFELFDATDATDAVSGIKELRYVDIVIVPGSAMETALLNFDTSVINRLNTLYPNKSITRPTS